MAKQKRRRSLPGRPPGAAPALHTLVEAAQLIERKRWTQARDLLEDLDRRAPERPETLAMLLDAYAELRDSAAYARTAERLRRHTPDDPELLLGLAGAYMATIYPFLAVRAFQEFLRRWPEHPEAGEAQRTAADIDRTLDGLLAEMGLAGGDGRALATLHEEARVSMERGRFAEARRLEERLLARRPDFLPALNNVSLAYAAEGDLDRAVATAQRVVGVAPENVHALSNLTRYCCLLGRVDEAATWAARLKAAGSGDPDVCLKKMEALSYLGDDEGVLAAFRDAERPRRAPPGDPLFCHLAAVAELRLGSEREARRLWGQALRLSPSYDLAKGNLDDLRRPVAERHAPWPFPFQNWLADRALRDLHDQVDAVAKRGGKQDEGEVARATGRYVRQHPAVAALVPLLLDRGDPAAREFALRLALLLRTPDLLRALGDFALGQRGPDAMRNEAASAASDGGVIPPGPVRMWLGGEWREVLLMGFEITDEPQGHHTEEVRNLLADAIGAVRGGKAERAVPLLQRALEIEPDAPEVWNNLAAAYSYQGRDDEALAIVRRLHERHPDYLFARVSLAREDIREGRVDEAKALLAPIMERKQFHVSELAAYCQAQIELCLAQGQREGARSWLRMWEGVDPDDPQIVSWTLRLMPPNWLRRAERKLR